MLEWQFGEGSKYFRPVTIFACFRSLGGGEITQKLIVSAAVLEMFHNVSLVIDDILDKSRTRRERTTLHCRFGNLQALMASGFIVAQGYEQVAEDAHDVRLLSELLSRLGVAECMQWRLRRKPLGVSDWRQIAGEDTGTMFEVCACLGTRDEKLRHFGRLLGLLYHGCDDVADMREAKGLGGGGDADLRDGILTLPTAFALRDPKIAAMHEKPSDDNLDTLKQAVLARLDEAEGYLDSIAEEARVEAMRHAKEPEILLALINEVRGLSSE